MQAFFTSPWVPAEWIRAHGVEPRGVWASDQFAPGACPLAAGVCAFADAVVRLARTERASAVIFATHCDQLRRGFDALAGEMANGFLFNLPATWQNHAAEDIFCAELERLGSFLIKLGGHPPPNQQLARILADYAHARSRLLSAASTCPARPYAEALARFHWDGSVNLPAPAAEPAPGSVDEPVALALVGGPLPKAHWGLLDRIGSAGGRVVLNATEAGERSLWAVPAPEGNARQPLPADENPASLLRWLAREYLTHCVDVFQRPNTRLYQWLQPRLALRQVRGILLRYFVGCDLWRAEGQSFREAFGLPVLLLEADETTSGSLREAGRLAAFVESLR